MSKQVYTVTKEGIEYLCGLINKIVTLPSDVIDNLNLADNTTFSSTKIDVLINQALLDANTHAEELCNALTKLTCEKTTVQPTLDNSELNIIYLFSDNGNAPFEQYLKISETELIDMGSTSVSLNNYLTATQIASTYAKKIDLDTLTTEVTNIKSDFNIHKDDTDIHVTKELKDKILTTDSITTTISSSSTDSEVPTAKAVNTKLDDKLDKTTFNNSSLFKNIKASNINITNANDLPQGFSTAYNIANAPTSTWNCYLTMCHDDSNSFKTQLAFTVGMSNFYIRSCNNGTWDNWTKK